MKYFIEGFDVHKEVDIYKEGCQQPYFSTCVAINMSADNQDILLQKICDFLDVENNDIEVNACDEKGRIDVQLMEDVDSNKPSKGDIASWKMGKKKLWLSTYSCTVMECKPCKLKELIK